MFRDLSVRVMSSAFLSGNVKLVVSDKWSEALKLRMNPE